jgi:hypothetical protein
MKDKYYGAKQSVRQIFNRKSKKSFTLPNPDEQDGKTEENLENQCCGSGIRCLFGPSIRDPEYVFSESWISDPGSQTHTFESLMTIFRVERSIILCKLAQIFFFASSKLI